MNRASEAMLRARISLFGPRRMTFGARLAVLALVLFAVGFGAYTRHYVDERVQARVSQQCASYGADLTSSQADETLYETLLAMPIPPNAGDGQRRSIEEFRRRLRASEQAKHRARDQKIELRRINHCPPYPPPPIVPPVPGP
jgi:hypothetical protein